MAGRAAVQQVELSTVGMTKNSRKKGHEDPARKPHVDQVADRAGWPTRRNGRRARPPAPSWVAGHAGDPASAGAGGGGGALPGNRGGPAGSPGDGSGVATTPPQVTRRSLAQR